MTTKTFPVCMAALFSSFALLTLSAVAEEKQQSQPAKLTAIEVPMSPLLPGTAPSSLSLSPNGKRVAFLRKSADGQQWTAVVDGVAGTAYDAMGKMSPLFSPDSQRVAYVAGRKGKKFVVLDGKEEPEYEGVGALTFSPDSQRFAYMVDQDNDRFIVLDGTEQPLRFDNISAFGILFSPDSQRFGYAAKRAGKWVVVVDGREGTEYDGAGNLVFSGDSQHYAYFALRNDKSLIVVDGAESEVYDGILKGTQIVFPNPGTVEVHAHRNGQILRVLLSLP